MGISKKGKITVWTVLATTLTALFLMVYSLNTVSASRNDDDDDDHNNNHSHATATPRPTATPTPRHDDHDDHDGHDDNHNHRTATPRATSTVRPTATPVATPVATPTSTPNATNDPSDICPNLPGVQTSLPSKDWYQLDPPSRECREFQYGGPESAHVENPGTPVIEGYGVGGQVLGASTMAGTGSFEEMFYQAIMTVGATLSAFGIKGLKKAKKTSKK